MFGEFAFRQPHVTVGAATGLVDISTSQLRLEKEHLEEEKGGFLYSAVSSPLNRSLHFTAGQTCSTPTKLLWEAFRHAAITAQKLFPRIFPSLSIARYSVLVYTAE